MIFNDLGIVDGLRTIEIVDSETGLVIGTDGWDPAQYEAEEAAGTLPYNK